MVVFKNFVMQYINNPKLIVVTILLIIFCILVDKYYPKIRGFFGEYWVKKELKKLPNDKYIVLNDIMISDNNGTHQIDHIVLSNYGIFVIEMKNYYGFVKGNEYDNKWCQYLGRHKSYFMNPIHQNYGHIQSLSKLLNIDSNNFISIICFSNQTKLSVKITTAVLSKVNFLSKTILGYKNVINDFDLNIINETLNNSNIVDKKYRKDHVVHVRDKIKHEEELINMMICPKCNAKLVEKSGRYGKFIGCSNYPKCRYIRK